MATEFLEEQGVRFDWSATGISLKYADRSFSNDDLKYTLLIRDELTSLDLTNQSHIDNKAFDYLERLHRLQSHTITGTGINKAGIARLQAALPKCKISASPPEM